MRILLAIDYSKRSHLALKEAFARLWRAKAGFLLPTVLAPLTSGKRLFTAVVAGATAEIAATLGTLVSHGHRGFDRMLVDSVSEAVAIHAKCRVEGIPPKERAAERTT